MRFMLMDRVRPGADEAAMPNDEQMAAMGTFMEENQGILHSTEGLHPTATGVRVTLSEDGQNSVTTGPFTDSISNFAIIHADSEEAAVEHAKAWLKIWGKGETEIRRVVEEEDLAEMMQQ
ncbi:MAG: hypothetical protein GEV12_03210 [Micromonosporaceae bacterium]|nr:hypothetical protein [Micromonosporaceae bacterium]